VGKLRERGQTAETTEASAPDSGILQRGERPDDLTAQGLRHLLLACADTKLLLGYHYGEWTFGTPELEAAVASCSLAQAELGHVRLLAGIVSKRFGDDPDGLVDGRSARQFASVGYLDHPLPDWPALVAANYVVDLAVTRLLHALRDSTFAPIRMSVAKMLDEERSHLHHGRGWVRTLARRGSHEAASLATHVQASLASVAEWFGPAGDPEDAALVAAGVKDADNPTVGRAVVQDVLALAREVGLPVEAPEAIGFDGWTAVRRRAGRLGPDEEILVHLRGSKNATFRV
jgi:ring-1,2-phenylacetyl-CoA epoxidase subunit PaaC